MTDENPQDKGTTLIDSAIRDLEAVQSAQRRGFPCSVGVSVALEKLRDANDDRGIGLIRCGGCELYSLLKDASEATHDDSEIDEPHCPRCGTRLSYEGTEVVHALLVEGDRDE